MEDGNAVVRDSLTVQPCKQRPGLVLPRGRHLPGTHRQSELGPVTPYPSLRQHCALPLPWGRHRPDPALLAQLTDGGAWPFAQHSSPSLDSTKQPHRVGPMSWSGSPQPRSPPAPTSGCSGTAPAPWSIRKGRLHPHIRPTTAIPASGI